MTRVVLYDDGQPALAALADLRPIFDVRTGRLTTRERIELVLGRRADALLVPAGLAPLARDATDTPVNPPDLPADALLVNGRCVLPPATLAILATGEALIEATTGEVIAARLDRSAARLFAESFALPDRVHTTTPPAPCLLRRPWDVIRFRDEAIRRDLDAAIADQPGNPPAGPTVLGAHAIRVDPSATLAPGITLDAQRGAIVIDAGVTIRPGAIIVGPASIGAGSTILEHALIKANTAIGPACKVAGEVGGAIFQSHSNKAHDGHLGDAWIGQWVNLGAGTINSNLLNTYGQVNAAATPDAPRERTGLTFFGCVLGDHVKTAIGTRIMTGAIIGAGAMIASTAPPPPTVRRFSWITDAASGEGAPRYKLDRFLEAAQRMMSRRGVDLTPALRARITALHEGSA